VRTLLFANRFLEDVLDDTLRDPSANSGDNPTVGSSVRWVWFRIGSSVPWAVLLPLGIEVQMGFQTVLAPCHRFVFVDVDFERVLRPRHTAAQQYQFNEFYRQCSRQPVLVSPHVLPREYYR